MSATSTRQSTGNVIISTGDLTTIEGSRGTFTKQFPRPFIGTNRHRVGLLNCSIYNSWDNLSSAFRNLSGGSYRWIDGVEYPVQYPPGSYDIEQLNGFFHYTMRANGHFLLDNNGSEVFFVDFVVNTVYYRVTATMTPVPTTLPEGWSNPNAINLATGLAPQFLVAADTEWYRLIGFAPGAYPSVQDTNFHQVNGSLPPRISPVSTVMIMCNWVNDNRFSTRQSCIATFSPDVGTGELINFTPQVLSMYDVTPNTYTGIEIRFFDQNYTPLVIRDTEQTVISLLITVD